MPRDGRTKRPKSQTVFVEIECLFVTITLLLFHPSFGEFFVSNLVELSRGICDNNRHLHDCSPCISSLRN